MILRAQNVCLNVGETAPEFTLKDQNGNEVSLSEYRGDKNILVILHPGKLTEMCRDYIKFYTKHLSDMKRVDTQLIAINMDSVEKNKQWVNEIGGLGFPLLSDNIPPGIVTQKYDCFVPKEGYGKRVVFLIDKSGKISHIEVVGPSQGACPDMSVVLEKAQKM
jgi:peroxiredoxin (alkyl hydroperoxide reductase subunit C)